jgi:putative Ca2+/H+ antiporter (TMEM165/GDT1 family)
MPYPTFTFMAKFWTLAGAGAMRHRGRMTQDAGFGLLFTTFVSVFIAELGDKTQLATLALSADAPSAHGRLYVFAGASLALIATSAIGVLAGAAMGKLLSPVVIQRAAGVLFVALGAWMLLRPT